MAEKQSGRTRGRWLGRVAFGVVGIGVGLLLCACKCKPPTPNLIIEDDLAAWMPLNNTFTVDERSANPVYDRDLRVGLLIQLGDYEHGEPIFGQVILKKDATVVDTYAKGEFTWINVVSPWNKADKPPMDADLHEYLLYPNNLKGGGYCGKIDACADLPFTCNNAAQGNLDGDCLRQRLLHEGFYFGGILTYWQGPKGYTVNAAQTVPVQNSPHPGQFRNEYQFSFAGGPFTVDVYKHPYKIVSGRPAPEKAYAAGAVTQIVVKSVGLKPPNHGSHQSPPWPPPDL